MCNIDVRLLVVTWTTDFPDDVMLKIEESFRYFGHDQDSYVS
jgi:hypothetical protein